MKIGLTSEHCGGWNPPTEPTEALIELCELRVPLGVPDFRKYNQPYSFETGF
jgi:hypothetical protein